MCVTIHALCSSRIEIGLELIASKTCYNFYKYYNL